MPTPQQNSSVDNQWTRALMQSPGFQRLSAEQIDCLFRKMREIPVRAGQIVFRQGERGEHYYVIKSGQATVSRWDGQSEHELARLAPSSTFGEDALIADSPRNATVTMDTNGLLMRLSRDDFLTLLQTHLVDEVDYATSRQLVVDGATRIDVRTEREFSRSGLRGAINIPLAHLREHLPQLDSAKTYIVYCDTGNRSAAATFLMNLNGFNARVLAGGLLKAQR